ncbi:MAG: hypothetical protein R3F11_29335 [Verrucomicrobiales bacterium]
MNLLRKLLLTSALLVTTGTAAFAQEEAAPTLDTGDTAWMLTSTVLVLLMCLPRGFTLYGGLVRAKNVLSIFVQCLAIAAVMTIIWITFGYAFAAGEGGSLIGEKFKDLLFLKHMAPDTLHGTIPESVWVTFQMTFIIITPALIVGAFAERMKFRAVLDTIWTILSYLPVWHMAWGGGLFAGWGVLDYAGGTVVHINAGIYGLLACIMIGKRKGYPQQMMPPHNVVYTAVGACLLWVGWFGFNAGSAGGASGDAGFAMITTQWRPPPP